MYNDLIFGKAQEFDLHVMVEDPIHTAEVTGRREAWGKVGASMRFLKDAPVRIRPVFRDSWDTWSSLQLYSCEGGDCNSCGPAIQHACSVSRPPWGLRYPQARYCGIARAVVQGEDSWVFQLGFSGRNLRSVLENSSPGECVEPGWETTRLDSV